MTAQQAPAAYRALTAGAPAVPVGIFGSGLYVAERVVGNSEIADGLDTTEAWIESRTGILTRHFAAATESTSDMCLRAVHNALEGARIDPGEVDAVIVSTITADQPLPSTAAAVAEALGAHAAWPIDLTQAACAGGVHGLVLAAHLLQNPEIGTVVVAGAETLSRITDPADRTTRVFFGDAAGAVVLRRTKPGGGLLAWDAGYKLSYRVGITAGGSRRPLTPQRVADGEHFLRMDGRAVWREATQALPASIRNVARRAGVALDDLDHVVLHQANLNIIHEVMDQLGVPRGRATTTVGDLGNTGSATVFTVLHQLLTSGRLRPGDLAVVSAIGAGFVWGSVCLRHH